MPRERVIAGIMSGTSADGIDVAFVRLSAGEHIELLAGTETPFAAPLRDEVLAIAEPGGGSAERVARLDFALAGAYAAALETTARAAGLAIAELDLIGCHGQTVAHLPGARPAATLQAGSGPALAALTGVPVVYDFRAADVALGGQGAPLIPYVDWRLFRAEAAERVVVALNLGGIANVTILPRGARGPGDVFAFDTGPGNMVIDRLARDLLGTLFDRDGAVAARGRVDDALLEELLAHEYFARPLPKSAGREEFGGAFVARLRAVAGDRPAADLLATATALTARSVARALAPFVEQPGALLVLGGGGARNVTLRAMLAAALPGAAIVQHEDLGWRGDVKEALGFALLADAAVRGIPTALPGVTGARAAHVLGALAPGRPPRVWPDWIGQA